MASSMLEKIAVGTAIAIPVAEAFTYENSAPNTTAGRVLGSPGPFIHTDITPYVGNFPETFAVCASSGIVGDLIMNAGHRKGWRWMENLGQYFPEIASGGIALYFSLGESLFPQILPGTADVRDIPAVLGTALAGYVLAKLCRRNGITQKIYDAVKTA